MNRLGEDDLLEAMGSCLDHPNLEVLQICEKIKIEDDDDPTSPKANKLQKSKAVNKVTICKGIQIRL
jgi:hypothetical protein